MMIFILFQFAPRHSAKENLNPENEKKSRSLSSLIISWVFFETHINNDETVTYCHHFLEDLMDGNNFFWLAEKVVGGWNFTTDALRLC